MVATLLLVAASAALVVWLPSYCACAPAPPQIGLQPFNNGSCEAGGAYYLFYLQPTGNLTTSQVGARLTLPSGAEVTLGIVNGSTALGIPCSADPPYGWFAGLWTGGSSPLATFVSTSHGPAWTPCCGVRLPQPFLKGWVFEVVVGPEVPTPSADDLVFYGLNGSVVVGGASPL